MGSKNHITYGKRGHGPMRCLGCKAPIAYGERCPPCQQLLRQRKRRKPR